MFRASRRRIRVRTLVHALASWPDTVEQRPEGLVWTESARRKSLWTEAAEIKAIHGQHGGVGIVVKPFKAGHGALVGSLQKQKSLR